MLELCLLLGYKKIFFQSSSKEDDDREALKISPIDFPSLIDSQHIDVTLVRNPSSDSHSGSHRENLFCRDSLMSFRINFCRYWLSRLDWLLKTVVGGSNLNLFFIIMLWSKWGECLLYRSGYVVPTQRWVPLIMICTYKM